MMNEEFESENIQVGSSQLWLPSRICTDSTIFNHIFSIDTWNTIFSTDQKDRIMKLLPPQILSTPGAALSTIEDLLSGTLSRFNTNPLQNFFQELHNGGYDPEVAEFKVKLKRARRSDALGRKRQYHTKLIQELIISSQNRLEKLNDKTFFSKLSPNTKSKSGKSKMQKQNTPKPAPTSKKKSHASKPSPLRQKVAKRLHNEIQAMNQAFPPVVTVPTDDSPVPPPKKPKRKPKKSDTHNKLTADQHSTLNSPYPIASSGGNRRASVVSKTTSVSSPPPPAIQMAKFPSVIPPSLIGVINVTQSPSGLSNSSIIQNHDMKVPLPVTSATPLISSQLMQKHVLKASPILASQLQAPIITAVSTHLPRSSVAPKNFLTTSMELQSLPNSTTTALPLTKTLKAEEETSSDEDEFEAIEPTIGFFSTVLPTTGNKAHSHKNPNSKGPTYQQRNHQVSSNKSLSVPKKKNVKGTNSQSALVTGTGTGFLSKNSTEALTVNVKTPNSVPTVTSTCNNQKILQKGTFKVTASQAPFLVQSSTPVNSTLSKVTVVKGQNHVTSSSSTLKLQPITFSTLAQQQQLNSKAMYRNVQNGSVMSTYSTQTPVSTHAGNTIGNGIPGVRSFSTDNSTSPFGTSSCLSSSPTTRRLHNSIPSLSPIPLTLSDLSLSLNLGLDVAGDKMEDKIDDLPVLDGTAFDSIPNLSDDLDVFDLDLVDGLCDFEVMLSDEKQYSSFFVLIREVLCSTQNHRMTYSCLEKTVQKWAQGPSSELNPWFHRIAGWSEALITALNFLAGNYQEIHPEDFVPYLEYKYKTKYYQWIGAGRDSDGNLLTLCNMWLDNLDKLPPVKKQDGDNEEQEEEEDENEDSDEHTEEVKKKYLRPKTPPPPRFITDWTVRPSTVDEKEEFQGQEKVRFDNPHKAFTYRMHNYESVVGPVKGVYSNQTGVTNKARGHSLLVDDRPPYVTILALVRDSVARLPNGEGTRSEICEMLRDSTFLAPEASNLTLNSVVSGALDRLHYERDPCVRYDSHKKNWIYLHRDRSQEQFERLHHNRSYTKSTKSRNNGGRKSRKKTLSQNSANETVSSSSGSTVQSTSSTMSSTQATTPRLTTPTTLSPFVTLHDSSVSSSISQPPPVPPPVKPSVINTLTMTTKPVTTMVNSFVSASAKSTTTSPILQFAMPISSNSTLLTKNWVSTDTELGNQAAQSSLPNSSVGASNCISPAVATGIGVINPRAFTTPTSSVSPKPMTVKLENPVSTPTTSNHNTSQLQQQGFILNNIFRLPNLKLPDNVRFMRVQSASPATGHVQLNALRLPQQRIVLRPTFPGYVPGQGLIFGQTPSGQTVIISAIGSPQVLSSPSAYPRSSQTTTIQSPEHSSTVLPTSSPSADGLGISTAKSPTQSNFVAINSPSVLNNSSGIKSNVTAVSQVTGATPPPSFVRPSNQPQRTLGSGNVVPNTNNKLPLEVAQFPGINQVGGVTSVPTSASATTIINTRLPIAPIPPPPVVLRTNQVECQNPMNRVTIGRGAGALQGIKMVPVTTAIGNQVYARLLSPVPPSPVTKPPGIQPSATSNTQALL